MVEMKPVIQPQPDQNIYGVQALLLFPRLTRATYFQMFSEQAPAWDPNVRIKRWFDTSVLVGSTDPDNELVTYTVFDEAQTDLTKKIHKLTMTKTNASKCNLPGVVVYPKWEPAPTPAVIVNPDGSTAGYNVSNLCYREEAETMAKEIFVDTSQQWHVEEPVSNLSGFFKVVWNGEVRRPFLLVGPNGTRAHAPSMLISRYSAGIGVPGKWIATPNPDPGVTFIAAVPLTGEQDVRPEIPIPMRELLPTEQIYPNPFNLQIIRTDKGDPRQQGGGSGCQLQAGANAKLDEIAANVKTLLKITVGV